MARCRSTRSHLRTRRRLRGCASTVVTTVRASFWWTTSTRRGVPGYVVVTPFDTRRRKTAARRSRLDRGAGVAQRVAGCPGSGAACANRRRVVVGERATTDTSAWNDGWPKRVEQFDGSSYERGESAARCRSSSGSRKINPEVSNRSCSARRCRRPDTSATRCSGSRWRQRWSVAYVVLGVRRGREP